MKAKKRLERLADLVKRLDDQQLSDLLDDRNGTGSPELLAAAAVESKRRERGIAQPSLNFKAGAGVSSDETHVSREGGRQR